METSSEFWNIVLAIPGFVLGIVVGVIGLVIASTSDFGGMFKVRSWYKKLVFPECLEERIDEKIKNEFRKKVMN